MLIVCAKEPINSLSGLVGLVTILANLLLLLAFPPLSTILFHSMFSPLARPRGDLGHPSTSSSPRAAAPVVVAHARKYTGPSSPDSDTERRAVSVRNLNIALGPTKRPILRGVSMDITRGTLHMILGPNGCGKSTLLQILGGLRQPDAGACRVEGPVGFVFQNPDHQVRCVSFIAYATFCRQEYPARAQFSQRFRV